MTLRFSFVVPTFVFRWECHECFAAAISACLRRPRGCFRNQCFTGGESTAAPRVNRFLAPIQRRARGYRQAASTKFLLWRDRESNPADQLSWRVLKQLYLYRELLVVWVTSFRSNKTKI